jgi:hypothetical protein
MKGLVFTEFLDFVAKAHGDDMVDDVIDDCQLPNGGAYTSVGTYHHTEMQALIAALAQRTGRRVPDILEQFGRHLCRRFVDVFPNFFQSRPCLFDFVESVEGYIHVEVRKLYPDAEFPSFKTHIRNGSRLEIDYRSCRPLAPLAEGLILGASDYFREPVSVDQRRHEDPDGSFVRFTIRHV